MTNLANICITASLNTSFLLELQIDNNLLTGSIPSTIDYFRNLILMVASQNVLSGNLPSSMCSMTNLVAVLVDNNIFSGQLPSCGGKRSR